MFKSLVVLSLIIPTNPSDKTDKKAVPSVMYQFLHHVTQLQAYSSSKENFKAPANQKFVAEELNKLSELSKNLPQHDRLEDPIFQMTASQVSLHLQEAAKSYKNQKFDYARRVYQEALDGCSSCHSQVRGKSNIIWSFDETKIKGSNFEKAEFWYTIRQYDKALKLYEEYVQNYKPDTVPIYELDIALNKIASILVRSFLDLDRAQLVFLRLSSIQSLPKATKQKLRLWSQAAARIKENPGFRAEIKTAEELQQIAESFFQKRKENQEVLDGDLVEILFLSGLLYDFSHRKEVVTPEILYYLARCEEILDGEFFWSMSNLYLRRCVVQFPTSPTAEKCLDEYKNRLELSYTGSGGENLPADVSKDIESLKKYMNDARSKKKKP